MAIATMEELADVPIGDAVVYKGRRYVRMDDQWWRPEESEPGTKVIREGFFSGAVKQGEVVLRGEEPLTRGMTAAGTNFWFYVKGPEVGGYVSCIRIVNERGQRAGYGEVGTIENWDRQVRAGWVREHSQPLSPEAASHLVAALLEGIERVNEQNTRLSTEVRAINGRVVDLDRELNGFRQLRDQFRVMLNS